MHLTGRSRALAPTRSPVATAEAAGPTEFGRLPGLRRRGPGIALALLVAVALAVWAWVAQPWQSQQALAVTGCDVQRQPCTARFPDGSTLTLHLTTPDGSAQGALRVAVQAAGFAPRRVGLDLDGETMAMGPNHLELQRGGDGRWQGDGALSACLSGPMNWVATLRARAGLGERVARFRFVSGEAAR